MSRVCFCCCLFVCLFVCLFAVVFMRRRTRRIGYIQTPTRLTLAMSEITVSAKIFICRLGTSYLAWERDVFPVVASLRPTGNASAFAGYELLCAKRSLFVDHRTNADRIKGKVFSNLAEQFLILHSTVNPYIFSTDDRDKHNRGMPAIKYSRKVLRCRSQNATHLNSSATYKQKTRTYLLKFCKRF